MADSAATERVSALAGHYTPGRFGKGANVSDRAAGVTLQVVPDLVLHQIAAWAESIDEVGEKTADVAGAKGAPGPCSATSGSGASILRTEPLKWLLYGTAAPALSPEQGATLDLSHSRTQIRITGDDAVTFLNRHLSLDLRENAFPEGSVASTVFHHVGVTLWRSDQGYEMFIPRGFALSLWEMLVETAEQFGLEVV